MQIDDAILMNENWLRRLERRCKARNWSVFQVTLLK
jgi:hypothetical protein